VVKLYTGGEKMKKIFATVLAILLLFSFTLTVGCQKTEPQPAAAPPAAAPAPAAPAAAPAEPEKKAEEVKPAESAAPAAPAPAAPVEKK
jgi:energy-converting hydrogenase Eha subunit F